jgi:hypothetical protein
MDIRLDLGIVKLIALAEDVSFKLGSVHHLCLSECMTATQ